MFGSWSSRYQLAILFIYWSQVISVPLMGPADVIIKYTEKCKFQQPKSVNFDLLLYSRRGKPVLDVNATLPFSFSDDIGFDMNVAVKRNGGWKPNFLKFKGDGLCTGVKAVQQKIFQLLAKQLKAPDPPKCPLPPGKFSLKIEDVSISAMMKKYGVEVLPYGEFRLDTNMTHKGTTAVIACFRTFVDLAPKKIRTG